MAQYQYRTYEYTGYDPTKVKGYSGENGVLQKKQDSVTGYDTWAKSTYDPTKVKGYSNASQNKTNYQTDYDTWAKNGFTFDFEDQLSGENGIINQILNRDKFSYDMNADALYQQYKDKYIQQGKMAMADTMGQAAAMTGGYGSSYSASVGNQAYQSSLQQLNDVIPELYQMAYDRYNQEGQDLYNQYGMLSSERATKYGEHMDKGNILAGQRDYWSGEESNLYNRGYGEHMDKGNILRDARDYWTGEESTLYDRGYNEHINTENSKSKAIDEENAYNKWEAETEIQESQFRRSLNNSSKTTTSTPSLSASDYNDVMSKAGEIAADGNEGELANYLNGLVNRGYLSGDEAADILEQFFPGDSIPGYDYSQFGKPLSPFTHLIN